VSCAVARIGFDWCKNSWFRWAVEAGEEWADTGAPKPGVDDVRRRLLNRPTRRRANDRDWVEVGLCCTAMCPEPILPNFRPGVQELFAEAVRELIPNPFVPIDWKADWFTSTVRDLARVIYDRRAFDLMPILADALFDAGCDHQLVQGHCRSGKPHARGCWVLDALLGKA
jgi:hypothetical protein